MHMYVHVGVCPYAYVQTCVCTTIFLLLYFYLEQGMANLFCCVRASVFIGKRSEPT